MKQQVRQLVDQLLDGSHPSPLSSIPSLCRAKIARTNNEKSAKNTQPVVVRVIDKRKKKAKHMKKKAREVFCSQ
jgi:hypothetical protein